MAVEPVFALTDLSKQADLVVVGRPGGGAMPENQPCSVSSTLIHHADCPVVVIHDDVQLSLESLAAPVLVGIDKSPEVALPIEIAFSEASTRGVGLVAVPTCQASERLDDNMAEFAVWAARYPEIEVRQLRALADPAPQLADHADKAQLVVVGSQSSADMVTMTHVPIIVARMSPAGARA